MQNLVECSNIEPGKNLVFATDLVEFSISDSESIHVSVCNMDQKRIRKTADTIADNDQKDRPNRTRNLTDCKLARQLQEAEMRWSQIPK